MHPGNTFEQERDGRGVALLAGFLEISEFEVFAEAFRAYYRRDAGLPELERHFGSYLRDGQVPFWVRDFVRKRLDALGIDTRRGEATFTYTDAKDRKHRVWFQTPRSAELRARAAARHEIGGGSVWSLGLGTRSHWAAIREGFPTTQ